MLAKVLGRVCAQRRVTSVATSARRRRITRGGEHFAQRVERRRLIVAHATEAKQRGLTRRHRLLLVAGHREQQSLAARTAPPDISLRRCAAEPPKTETRQHKKDARANDADCGERVLLGLLGQRAVGLEMRRQLRQHALQRASIDQRCAQQCVARWRRVRRCPKAAVA